MASAPTTTEVPQPRTRRRRAAERDASVPRLSTRTSVIAVALLVLFAALFLRLWALQVLAGTKYVAQAQANSYRTLRIQAPRGLILDRNGVPIVTDSVAQAVDLWPADLPKTYPAWRGELRRLAQVTQVPVRELVRRIKERLATGDALTPVTVRDDASRPLVEYLYEHSPEFPGVTMERSTIRHYPYGSLAAQLLGYVGEASTTQLKQLGRGYAPGDELGQSGVESTFDTYLRGVVGLSRLHVDSLGRPRSTAQTEVLPKRGNSVRLTLDAKLQKAAERALLDGINFALADKQWYARGGAIVALDPTDGSILAMASSPSYNPSVFTGRVTERSLAHAGLTRKTALLHNYPSLNRAIQATYPPGSTFKPVTALAAMQEHLISPYAYLPCTPTFTAPEDRSHRTFHNWDPYVDQAMDLPTALAYSCDTYFYRIGNKFYELPGDRGQPLQKWAQELGFGTSASTDAGPEAAGLVPTIGWRRSTFTKRRDPCCWQVDRLWKPGDSIQLAIGQGDLLVTPLQMARFYALLANGGNLVTPHLLVDVESQTGVALRVPPLAAPRSVSIDPAALRVVRQGLWEGTHLPFGTSYAVFGNFPVSIAGKTGTAEKVVSLPGYTGTQNQSWWCGYGPTEAPKLVVCAVIENGGHGGVAAAPAAAEVFASFFHVKIHQATATHSD